MIRVDLERSFLDRNNRVESALHLAEMHFAVFPLWWPSARNECACGDPACESKGKHPIAELAPNGVKNATLDTDVIRAWWEAYPKANVAVATGHQSGGLAVLDIDCEAADLKFRQLCTQHGTPELFSDDVLRVRTASGYHVWCVNYDEEISKGRIWSGQAGTHEGIDLQVGTSYVIAPTSRHATGAWYEYMSESRHLPILPEWVCEMASKRSTYQGLAPGERLPDVIPSAYIRKALENIVSEMAAVQEGGRDNALTRLATKMGGWLHYVDSHTERDEWAQKLYEAALATGLPDNQAAKVFDKIQRAEPYVPTSTKLAEFEARSPVLRAAEVDFKLDGGTVGWDELDSIANEAPDWLVPDLFLRGTTFALTGNGGAGKMTWLRQLGIRIAGGIHPFKDGVQIPARKVMFIDLQDNKEVNAHNWKGIWDSFDSYESMAFARSNAQLVAFPAGCNIFADEHHKVVESHIKSFEPDMIIIGPVYRMFEGDGVKEDVIRGVTRVIDAWIEKYKCSFFIEAHPPKSNAQGQQVKSVSGSSVWERWAQSGYFAQVKVIPETHLRVMSLEAWRYPRLQYDFVPEYFTSEGPWLWNATTKERLEQQQDEELFYSYGECISFITSQIMDWPRQYGEFITVNKLNTIAHERGFKFYHIRRALAQLHGSQVEKHRSKDASGEWILVPKGMSVNDLLVLDNDDIDDVVSDIFDID